MTKVQIMSPAPGLHHKGGDTMPKPVELDDEELIDYIGEFVDELNERL